jgi:hypothetical protein
MAQGAMLDDLSLPLVQDVRTLEERAWVTHVVPGRDGAAHQHLGRRPAVITVIGVFAGETSLEQVELVRKKFQAHLPIPFVADIATATDVKNVVLDDLRVTEVAGRPQEFRYVLRLVEHLPPPPPQQVQTAPGVDLDAAGLLDDLTGALGDLPELPELLDLNLVNPVPPLQSLIGGVAGVTEQMTSALQPLLDVL